MKRKIIPHAALGSLALTTGCAHAEPWKRQTLADYTMRPDCDPLAGVFAEPMWFSREAAFGGRGVGGGGCGCN